eukprot:5760535-Pyramimonas_sp.AAC.2
MGTTPHFKSEVYVTTFDGKRGKIVAFSKRVPNIVSPDDTPPNWVSQLSSHASFARALIISIG